MVISEFEIRSELRKLKARVNRQEMEQTGSEGRLSEFSAEEISFFSKFCLTLTYVQ